MFTSRFFANVLPHLPENLNAEAAMNDLSLPKISVVIPTCHRNDLLALCLDCLAPGVQTLPPEQYEVIVTDDGSRSTAQQMVQERYSWAKWVAGPRRGPAANRNHGAFEAVGEWLAFTDDDCLPLPGWLEGYVQALDEEVSVYEGKTTCEAGITSPLYQAPVNLTGGCLWSCNFMVRHCLFDEISGFDTEFTMPAGEDIDFQERLTKQNEPIVFVDKALVDHPPRREPFGRDLGEKYQAVVQLRYKSGHQGVYWVFFLKHIKHRLYRLTRFRLSWDFVIAFLSLTLETIYIARHLSKWQKQFQAYYGTQESVEPQRVSP